MTTTRQALKRKKAITVEHLVPADDEQAIRLSMAAQRLNLARFSGKEEEVAQADEHLKAVRDEVRETGIALNIRSVGRLRFEELTREHPPTDQQQKDGLSFDPAGFWPALFSEAIEGKLSPDEWRTNVLEHPDWGAGEVKALRDDVMAANIGTRVRELGN